MFTAFLCVLALSIYLREDSSPGVVGTKSAEEGYIKVAMLNISAISHEADKTFTKLLSDKYDVLAFQDVGPEWDNYIRSKFITTHPYEAHLIGKHNDGHFIYSRKPILEVDTITGVFNPTLAVSIESDLGSCTRVVSVDASYTSNTVAHDDFRSYLTSIAGYLTNSSIPVICLGAFDLVSGSPEFQDFIALGKLSISDSHWNPIENWSINNHIAQPLHHIFFNKELVCTQFSDISSVDNSIVGISGIYEYRNSTGDLPGAFDE